eukprot:Gb_35732 [translate_table: standard]
MYPREIGDMQMAKGMVEFCLWNNCVRLGHWGLKLEAFKTGNLSLLDCLPYYGNGGAYNCVMHNNGSEMRSLMLTWSLVHQLKNIRGDVEGLIGCFVEDCCEVWGGSYNSSKELGRLEVEGRKAGLRQQQEQAGGGNGFCKGTMDGGAALVGAEDKDRMVRASFNSPVGSDGVKGEQGCEETSPLEDRVGEPTGVYIFMGVLLGRLPLRQVVNIHGHENLMVHNTVECLILNIYHVTFADPVGEVLLNDALRWMGCRGIEGATGVCEKRIDSLRRNAEQSRDAQAAAQSSKTHWRGKRWKYF